jgi:hypothetical protein
VRMVAAHRLLSRERHRRRRQIPEGEIDWKRKPV